MGKELDLYTCEVSDRGRGPHGFQITLDEWAGQHTR